MVVNIWKCFLNQEELIDHQGITSSIAIGGGAFPKAELLRFVVGARLEVIDCSRAKLAGTVEDGILGWLSAHLLSLNR